MNENGIIEGKKKNLESTPIYNKSSPFENSDLVNVQRANGILQQFGRKYSSQQSPVLMLGSRGGLGKADFLKQCGGNMAKQGGHTSQQEVPPAS